MKTCQSRVKVLSAPLRALLFATIAVLTASLSQAADFGDLPDTTAGTGPGNYSTLLANGGPRHAITGDLALGTTVTAVDDEADGIPGAGANGDDLNNTDDEAGVTSTLAFTAGGANPSVSFNVTNGANSAAAGVCAFLDLDGDGAFVGVNEVLFSSVAANGTAAPVTTATTLNFLGPVAAVLGNGTTYLRLRVSRGFANLGSCSADGLQNSGEVEDYPVQLNSSGDISIFKTIDGAATYTPGQAINYIITVVNQSATTAANGVIVTDIIPTSFSQYTYNTSTILNATVLSGASGSGADANNDLINDSPGTITAVLNLQPGGQVDFNVSAVARVPTSINPLNNTASLAFPAGYTDTVPGNNSSTVGAAPSGTPGGVGASLCAINPNVLPSVNITTANQVVNSYFSPATSGTTNLTVGQRCLPVSAVGFGAAPNVSSSLAGDQKLLVIQMQDASGMSVADNGTYGNAFLANNGVYEYVRVRGAVGTGGCAAGQFPINGGGPSLGLVNAYSHAPVSATKAVVQYVRVLQAQNITVNPGASAAALPWDGAVGGVVAIDASNTLDLGNNAVSISATCRGYRGGGTLAQAVAISGNRGAAPARRTTAIGNGTKGEGSAGTPGQVYDFTNSVVTGSDLYPNGGQARGAPGNAGGGGNACSSVTPAAAAPFETGGGAGGGNGGGGGTGGTCISDTGAGTGQSLTGGVVGRAIPDFVFNSISTGSDPRAGVGRAIMGAGGGSGALAAGAAPQGSGGQGGGIVMVTGKTIINSGGIIADGCNGVDSVSGGGGGGGAGGTIVLLTSLSGSTTYAGVNVEADGGNGASAGAAGLANRRGPGGAGGGGRVFYSLIENNNVPSATIGSGNNGLTDGTAFGSSNADQGDNVGQLNVFNSVPGAKPGFVCESGTVPVTLSKVAVSQEGSEMVIRFNTASEAGTLGYRLLADVGPNGSFSRTELGFVDSKSIDSLKEQSYELRTRSIGASQIWIEEQSVDGKAALYGPYAVGNSVGEANLAPAMNWSAVNAEQTRFRSSQQIALRGQSTGRAEVSISADGWVSFSAAELAAAGITGSDIAVSQGARAVATKVDRSASGSIERLGFYGQSVQASIYTKTAVYSLTSGRSSAISTLNAVTSGGADSVLSDRVFDQNALYSFTAPLDPWFNFRALRNISGTINGGSSNFTLSDYAGAAAERLQISYWGGSSYSGAGNDHHVQFLLNGQIVGSDQFDGFASRSLDVAIPAGVLRAGQNTLSLQMVNDTGFASDIVNVESYTPRYRRSLAAEGNRLNVAIRAINASDSFANGFEASQSASQGPSSYTISNLTAPAVVLLERAGVQSLLATSTGASVSVQFNAQLSDRLIVSPAQGALSLTAAADAVDPIGSSPASYLIISHPSFIGGLSSFITAKQQQGFTVKVVDVEALYRYYNAGVADPAAISLAIKSAQKLGVTNVLLVGGDTYDYLNVLGINSVSFVPTHYRRTDAIVNFAPADSVYADTDGNGSPNVALGRWPVRTNAELQAVIAKTLSYQNSRKAVLVNDRALNGERYSQAVAPFAALLGQNWSNAIVDLDAYTDTTLARTELVSRLTQGASLLSYYGHSAPASWSREGLITASQLSNGLLNSVNQSFVTVQLGCWGTYFVEPTSTTVAHQLLLMPKGAAAVMGASSLTQTNSDKAFAGYVLPNFGGQSIGNTLKGALESMSQDADARDVTVGGTLLGDPSLQ